MVTVLVDLILCTIVILAICLDAATLIGVRKKLGLICRDLAGIGLHMSLLVRLLPFLRCSTH